MRKKYRELFTLILKGRRRKETIQINTYGYNLMRPAIQYHEIKGV